MSVAINLADPVVTELMLCDLVIYYHQGTSSNKIDVEWFINLLLLGL